MWCATTKGFFSIVVNTRKAGTFLVRARERGDLENVCASAGLDAAAIQDTPERDYAFRIVVTAKQLGKVFSAFQASITYPNFKAAVHDTPGQERKISAYSRIWSVMADVQPTAPYSGARRSR